MNIECYYCKNNVETCLYVANFIYIETKVLNVSFGSFTQALNFSNPETVIFGVCNDCLYITKNKLIRLIRSRSHRIKKFHEMKYWKKLLKFLEECDMMAFFEFSNYIMGSTIQWREYSCVSDGFLQPSDLEGIIGKYILPSNKIKIIYNDKERNNIDVSYIPILDPEIKLLINESRIYDEWEWKKFFKKIKEAITSNRIDGSSFKERGIKNLTDDKYGATSLCFNSDFRKLANLI